MRFTAAVIRGTPAGTTLFIPGHAWLRFLPPYNFIYGVCVCVRTYVCCSSTPFPPLTQSTRAQDVAVHRERATQGAFPPACHHFGELGTVYIVGNNFGGELLNFWWSLFACNTQIKTANISSYHHNIGELDIMLVVGTVYTTTVAYMRGRQPLPYVY